MKLIDLLQGVNVALHVIQARLLTLVTLVMAFGLAAWAMWLQTVLAAIIALGWGLVIFLPVLFHDRGGGDVSQAPQQPEGTSQSS